MKYLNPIFKKELKQTARMKRTVFLLFFYNAALTVFGLFAFYLAFHEETEYRFFINYADILRIYSIITGIEFAFILLLVPALTASSIASERERQTLDILLTTGMPSTSIVIGKLLASISMMLLLAFSSLPIISIVFSIGGISLLDLVKFMILIIVTAIYIGSIGIFFSTMCRKTTSATVCTYLVMLFLVLGTCAILLGMLVIRNMKENVILDYKNIIWYSNGIGKFVYLLIINPLYTFVTMLRDQIGFSEEYLSGIAVSGNLNIVVTKNWFSISLIIQLILSFIFLWLAQKRLNPRKKRQYRGADISLNS